MADLSKNKNILIFGEFSVFHKGYIKFLNEISKNKNGYVFFVGILNRNVIKELTKLESDIRKISQKDVIKIINSYVPVKKYFILGRNNFSKIIKSLNPEKIIILKGENSEKFVYKYLKGYEQKYCFDYYDIRLKWRDSKVLEFRSEPSVLQEKELKKYKKFMLEAENEAKKAKCWWRRVGAVAVKDKKIIFRGFNKMLPTDDECYKIGCIRDSLEPGKQSEICSVAHAEALLISLAAKNGVSLKDAVLYITHFPCPACAKLIALSGFKKVIYKRGSSVFDGEKVLKSSGVEIVKI